MANKKYRNFSASNLKHECGVLGVINSPTTSYDLYLGLHSLQHRGQEASGITTINKDNFVRSIKKAGSIATSFTENDIQSLEGIAGIGHVRYSTFGGTSSLNIQPFTFTLHTGIYITAHNGNITNAPALRKKLENRGSIFFSFSDSELLGHLLNLKKTGTMMSKMITSVKALEGAFSFVVLSNGTLYGIRDKEGLRPLVLGKKNQSYILSSETVGLDAIGATFVRDIEPGEIIEITPEGKISSSFYVPEKKIHHNMCAMEFIYFARPDSVIEGTNVHKAREELGRTLAKEHHVDADIVIGVPDSSIPAALGYSKASKIPFEVGLVKNKYIGRSFIAPSQKERKEMIKMKLNPNKQVLKDKRIILVDDSIVRGTTMEGIVELIHNAGAKEIHLRIAAPELKWPCYYGVDISTKSELAMNRHTKEQYLKILKYVKSLEFISKNGLQTSLNRFQKQNQLCMACFTGKYVTKIKDHHE